MVSQLSQEQSLRFKSVSLLLQNFLTLICMPLWRNWRAALDLKSNGKKFPYEFESHQGHETESLYDTDFSSVRNKNQYKNCLLKINNETIGQVDVNEA